MSAMTEPTEPRRDILRRRWVRSSLKLALAVVAIGLVIYAIRFSRVPVSTHRVELGPIAER